MEERMEQLPQRAVIALWGRWQLVRSQKYILCTVLFELVDHDQDDVFD